MPSDLSLPIIYLITNGTTTRATTPESNDFARILALIEAAVAAQISLLQIREKDMSARVLYQLTSRAAGITRGSGTRLLVNDRSDIARDAGADGVQLATRSLPADVVRATYGPEFLIGVSSHSVEEARAAREAGGDFVVFGPVFETASKVGFGEPQGLGKLAQVAQELREFPVVAIGGVSANNAGDCFRAGATGVAAIRWLSDAGSLGGIVKDIRSAFH